jgi:arsenite methyltransferase
MKVARGSRLLDVGSGLGTTAVHLARTMGCRVTGVTLEPSGVESGDGLARDQGVDHRVAFVQGSIADVELEDGSFDHVMFECVLSIIPDRVAVLDRVVHVLRPGGRLGLTDVTVRGELPGEIQGVLAAVGCVAGAVSLGAYADLIRDAGLEIERSEDRVAPALLYEADRLLDLAEEQVRQGTISYGLIVARKPS